MAFHKTLHYPRSLITFIANHAQTLRDLALPLIPFQRFSPDMELHEALIKWLVHLVADDKCLSQLQCLEIYHHQNDGGAGHPPRLHSAHIEQPAGDPYSGAASSPLKETCLILERFRTAPICSRWGSTPAGWRYNCLTRLRQSFPT